jgi:hypothetical protein
MFQRVMMIGLLVISAVVMFVTDANAQFFDGWGFNAWSSITAVIDLSRVPNPDAKPSIVTLNGSLDFIEVICTNPVDHNVAPGNAGRRLVAAANAIDNGEITDKVRGLATVEITFGTEELAAAEDAATCVNPKWNVVPGTAANKSMSLTMKSFRCIPESKTDLEPCVCNNIGGCAGGIPLGGLTVETTPRDIVNLGCSVDPILRDLERTLSDGTTPNPEYLHPLHGQVFSCVEK